MVNGRTLILEFLCDRWTFGYVGFERVILAPIYPVTRKPQHLSNRRIGGVL
jgi:hypothetical protein